MKRLAVVAFTLSVTTSACACIHFQITAQDKTLINARSMEFALGSKTGQSLPADFVIVKKGTPLPASAGRSTLAFAGIQSAYGILTEGINEKGLSVALLWFEDSRYPANLHQQNSLSNTAVAGWALGQFSSAKDVIAQLDKMNVYGAEYADYGGVSPTHYAITDTSGANYVVEFNHGKMNVLDNSANRLLTNEPRLETQWQKLSDWLKVHPEQKRGGGAPGTLDSLPGGYGSMERFLKISVLKGLLPPAENSIAAINQSINLLNNVDYPRGVPSDAYGDEVLREETSWVSLIDLKRLRYYYRTHDNYNLRMVDLKKVGFEKDVKFSLYGQGGHIISVTPGAGNDALSLIPQ